jgi:hypothetical protein
MQQSESMPQKELITTQSGGEGRKVEADPLGRG